VAWWLCWSSCHLSVSLVCLTCLSHLYNPRPIPTKVRPIWVTCGIMYSDPNCCSTFLQVGTPDASNVGSRQREKASANNCSVYYKIIGSVNHAKIILFLNRHILLIIHHQLQRCFSVVQHFCVAAEWPDERVTARSQAARLFWSTDRSCSWKVVFYFIFFLFIYNVRQLYFSSHSQYDCIRCNGQT